MSDGNLDAAELDSEPAGFAWTLFKGDKVTGNAAKCTGTEAGALCVEETASASNNLDNLVLDANQTTNGSSLWTSETRASPTRPG